MSRSATLVESSHTGTLEHEANSLYARVGGIPVGELNMLEREFLRMIDWRLTVRFSDIQLI